jgi:hypothetical protein
MFTLGNHSFDEILQLTSTNFNDQLLYTADQFKNASIAVTADSIDITDKKGNVVRRIYRTKNGEFNSTSAFLHPALMNAGSGSDITVASTTTPITGVPRIEVVAAGGTLDVSDADAGSIQVIGIYSNGANGAVLAAGTTAVAGETYAYDSTEKTVTVPAGGTDLPVNYVVQYTRSITAGIKLVNEADKFPNAQRLRIKASYVDPCSDTLKAAYIYIPSFMPDPSMTLNFDSENQEMEFNGTLQLDYCGSQKLLYVIYYPDNNVVVTGTATDEDGE